MTRILKDVTYGVSTTGNIQALLMSLTSILTGDSIPCQILIRSEGEFPAFGNFYMEQIAELARVKEVEFSITSSKSQGIRFARDWLINNCRTRFLWMGDDDVVYDNNCLSILRDSADVAISRFLREDKERFAYINGNKPDINNRRGYTDFSLVPVHSSEVKDDSGYNALFEGPNKVVRCGTADTGNLLIDVENIRRKGVTFSVFKETFNSSGDDTLFALICDREGLTGFFAVRADSFHLEKPNVRFNEFTARKNMLLRECELLGLDKSKLKSMLPWLQLKSN